MDLFQITVNQNALWRHNFVRGHRKCVFGTCADVHMVKPYMVMLSLHFKKKTTIKTTHIMLKPPPAWV